MLAFRNTAVSVKHDIFYRASPSRTLLVSPNSPQKYLAHDKDTGQMHHTCLHHRANGTQTCQGVTCSQHCKDCSKAPGQTVVLFRVPIFSLYPVKQFHSLILTTGPCLWDQETSAVNPCPVYFIANHWFWFFLKCYSKINTSWGLNKLSHIRQCKYVCTYPYVCMYVSTF